MSVDSQDRGWARRLLLGCVAMGAGALGPVLALLVAGGVVALAACDQTPGPKQLSAAGLKQLVNDEGGFRYYRTVTLPDGTRAKRWVPYNDSKGYCTVGHGHLIARHRCTATERRDWTITNARADQLLYDDAQSRVKAVNRLVTAPLTQAQFDALVNFVYNAGVGRTPYRSKGKLHKPGLIGSGILAAVNAGQDRKAAQLIRAYISRSERKTSPGLIGRREREALPFEDDCSKATTTTGTTTSPSTSSTTTTTTKTTTSTTAQGTDTITIATSAPTVITPDGRNLGYGIGRVTITYTGPAGGTTSVGVGTPSATQTVEVKAGTSVSVVATWDDTSYFAGWSSTVCETQEASCSFTADADTEITGNFGVATYELTIDASPMADGSVTTQGDYGIDCGPTATECGPAQERSNVPIQFDIAAQDANGTAHEVDSVSGCTYNAQLPAYSVQCTATPSQDTTIAVTYGEG